MAYTYTVTETFTLTHARRLAAKVAADMHQCQRLYGHLTDTEIKDYQQELTVLLLDGYIRTYEFGFKTKDGRRVVSWYYTVGPSGDLEGGRSGGLFPTADISTAVMFNFLTYSSEWFALNDIEKDKVRANYTVRRATGTSPQDGNGYWDTSRYYVSGGAALTRKEFRPW